MNAPDYMIQQQAEEERLFTEIELCKRIAQGITTLEDALLAASSLGILKEFQNEQMG